MQHRWSQAINLFKSGDISGALYRFRKLASEGVEQAYLEIANIYELGEGGVEKNFEKAIRWYKRAIQSSEEHPGVHLGLGRIYLQSDNNEDHSKALVHFSKVKDQEMGAQYALGEMYEMGVGVVQNLQEAIKFYEAAASQGHIMANARLIKLRKKGNGPLSRLGAWFQVRVFLWKSLGVNPAISDRNHPLVGVSSTQNMVRHNKSLNTDASDAGAG